MKIQAVSAVTKTVSYCTGFGLELEVFSSPETMPEMIVDGGCITNDAGYNLAEFITNPSASLSETLTILRRLVDVEEDVWFTSKRPPCLLHNANKWQKAKRYDALRAALEIERPGHRYLVNQMTERAALHINLSGDFNPFGDDGAFLVNFFNEAALYVAAAIHREIDNSYGHLSIWRDFARDERLPKFGRWFATGGEMRKYIESTPKLLAEKTFEPLPEGQTLSIESRLDLSTLWWFARPKVNDGGAVYMEFRLLPSMPLSLVEKYSRLVVEMVESLLNWYHGPNRSNPVTSRRQLSEVYQSLPDVPARYLPKGPMSHVRWVSLFRC